MNKTGGCISARCPCRTELSWCLIHVCRVNCKAEAERHQMQKTLLKVLCKGALRWRCPHSSGAGGCPALLCLAPLCLEERRGLCLWAPTRAGSPRSSTGSSWEFGGKRRWMTHSHHSAAVPCRTAKGLLAAGTNKNAEVTPPVADQNPTSTRQSPSWWNLAACWISRGPGAMFRRTQQMGVCLIKVDSHNGTVCNSIRRLSVTGQCYRLGDVPAKVWPLCQLCQARS